MNLYEFEAKEILAQYGVPVPEGRIASTAEEAEAAARVLPGHKFAVKAQILAGGRGLAGFRTEFALGYSMAVCCALTWSGYSVLNRRFQQVPTDTVGGFCAVTAVLSLICHLLFEQTLWPEGALEWLGVIGLGLGPVGIAFFTWDYGTKHGDIQVLGALSYAAPLISTVLLIAFGKGEATWIAAAGCLLIVGGAVLASKELLRRRKAG